MILAVKIVAMLLVIFGIGAASYCGWLAIGLIGVPAREARGFLFIACGVGIVAAAVGAVVLLALRAAA